MLITAQLAYQPRPRREATAWFLPGPDASAWLEEICGWPVPSHELRLYIVGQTGAATGIGLLVVPEKYFPLPAGSRAQPQGELRPGFYLPLHADLIPPLAPEEIPAEYPVVLFHPSAGLVGFDAHAELRTWQLLQPPSSLSEAWNAARAVAPANATLRSIAVAQTLSIEDIFGPESQGIGELPPAALPRLPDEAEESPVGELAGAVGKALARLILKLTALVPRRPGVPPTWVNHLENWLSGKIKPSASTTVPENLREKEIQRLLKLLAENPEEGLRHAISLANLASRGAAPPSHHLHRRLFDFSLSRLGGRPADNWSIAGPIRTSLAKTYRTLAQKELALGRFRRAAYIYAELLGDLSSAATALKQGKFFEEAALLYQQRLNSPLAAAECFAKAGLYAPAIAIFEKHSRWLDAADAYERLGDMENARREIERAVQAALTAGDAIKAAQLSQSRLSDPERALQILRDTWPNGRQAMLALDERFNLLRSLARWDESRSLATALAEEKSPAAAEAEVIGLLSRQMEKFSHAPVRDALREAVLIKAARGLSDEKFDAAQELSTLRALTRFGPGDRLLSRDALRFRHRRKIAPTRQLNSARREIKLVQNGQLNLPKAGEWVQFQAVGDFFYAVAHQQKGRLTFSRGTWAGAIQSADWEDPGTAQGENVLVCIEEDLAVLARPLSAPLEIKHLPATDAFNSLACHVGTPPWLPHDCLQGTSSRFTVWVIRVVQQRVILASYLRGDLVYSRDVTDALVAAGASSPATRLHLDARASAGRIALAYGHHLLVMENQRELIIQDLGAPILELLPAPPVHPGWVAIFPRGAAFVPADNKSIISLDSTTDNARVLFLRTGEMLLFTGDKLHLANISEKAPEFIFSTPFHLIDPLVVTTTDQAIEFAVIKKNGHIQRWIVK